MGIEDNSRCRCHHCGVEQPRAELTSELFFIDGRVVLVEDIPARICQQCGKATFSRKTTEKIRRMVHGEAEPVKSVQVDGFAYA